MRGRPPIVGVLRRRFRGDKSPPLPVDGIIAYPFRWSPSPCSYARVRAVKARGAPWPLPWTPLPLLSSPPELSVQFVVIRYFLLSESLSRSKYQCCVPHISNCTPPIKKLASSVNSYTPFEQTHEADFPWNAPWSKKWSSKGCIFAPRFDDDLITSIPKRRTRFKVAIKKGQRLSFVRPFLTYIFQNPKKQIYP